MFSMDFQIQDFPQASTETIKTMILQHPCKLLKFMCRSLVWQQSCPEADFLSKSAG
jgi:hypothetical protein